MKRLKRSAKVFVFPLACQVGRVRRAGASIAKLSQDNIERSKKFKDELSKVRDELKAYGLSDCVINTQIDHYKISLFIQVNSILQPNLVRGV